MSSRTQDRRVVRTRTHIVGALNELLFVRGYDGVSVREITQRANVGRSTFYENFDGKDDALRASLATVLEPLAASLTDTCDTAALTKTLAHFRDGRTLALSILTGGTRPLAVALLAELVAEQLDRRVTTGRETSLLPMSLVATQIAQAQVGLIAAWLLEDAPCTDDVLADAVVRTSQAIVAAIRA